MMKLSDAISSDCCMLFAGSGVCRDAGLPDWKGLFTATTNELHSSKLISTKDKEIGLSMTDDPLQITQGFDYLETKTKRADLITAIFKLLSPLRKSKTVEELRDLKFRGIITTNYDNVINYAVPDTAWRATNSVDDLKNIDHMIGAKNRQFLFKIHGSIDNISPSNSDTVLNGAPFMVLTKSDYAAFMGRAENLKFFFHSFFTQGPSLFLGYSFNDPDINFVLDFIFRYCNFKYPSWYVGLQGETKPQLPKNVEFITPIRNWSELPNWLKSIKPLTPTSPPTCEIITEKLSSEEAKALAAIIEFIDGIETDDLATKTIASIVVPEILSRDSFSKVWLTEFISDFLYVGPSWANTYAELVINQYIELGIIKPTHNADVFVIQPHINYFHTIASKDEKSEKELFVQSLLARFKDAKISVDDKFIKNFLDSMVDLSMHYGENLAKWIHQKVGLEDTKPLLEGSVSKYFAAEEDKVIAISAAELLITDPSRSEIPYLYRLISASILLSSIKLKPVATNLIKNTISNYQIYLDTNILLPLVVEEHDNHQWIKSIITTSRKAGVSFFVLDDFVEELAGHRGLARTILFDYGGDIKKIEHYSLATGQRANCFVKGYINYRKKRNIKWLEYLDEYSNTKVTNILESNGIFRISADFRDRSDLFVYVLESIKDIWSSRPFSGDRNPRLNEHEAKQFLLIYNQREKMKELGKPDDIWFLSYETVFEQLYQLEPQRWRRPITFRLSAWASFIDSYIMFSDDESKRSDIIKAIMRSSSAAYDLPTPFSLVKQKAFGNRPITKEQLEALKISISDSELIHKLERAQKGLASRRKARLASDEFDENLKLLTGEVSSELKEGIKQLKSQLGAKQDAIDKKDKTIQELEARLRSFESRRKNKERSKKKTRH